MSSKVVLIEDHTEVRENIKEILELDGYIVYDAENGKLGVDLIRKHLPHIIICDIMMPELDGYGVLKIIRRDDSVKHIPFIFLTAKNEMKDMRMGMTLGADDYLPKPFTDLDLLETVSIRIRRAKDFRLPSKSIETTDAPVFDSGHLISEQWQRFTLCKGDTVYREGAYPDSMFIIKNGLVKLVKKDKSGKELILKILSSEDFLGHIALIGEQKHFETAICMSDVELAAIHKTEFFKLVDTRKTVFKSFVKMMAGDIKDVESQLLTMAYSTVKRRIVDALLKLNQQIGDHQFVKIKRSELASFAGTAKETTIRTLKELKESQYIELKHNGFTVVDRIGLEQLIHQEAI